MLALGEPNALPSLHSRRHLVGGLLVSEVAPAFQTHGAPPVLFVHGAFQGAWTYGPWQQLFAACGWRACAMSLRNHPGSRQLADAEFLALRPEHYVADVLEIASWLGGRITLVGHSMGAQIVLKAAERLPELEALVLLGCGAVKGLGASRPRDLPEDEVARPHYQQVRQHMFGDIDDADYAEFYARLVPETPGVMNRTGRGRIEVFPEQVRAPLLAVDAEVDRNRYGPEYARRYGGSYIVVPGARHALMLGSWGAPVASAIQTWLAPRTLDFQYAHRPGWFRPLDP